jgi:DNA-binding NtrC family response regulator
VIGASNANLEEWVAARRFREDLYYRLKVLSITVPPLRERREAIRPLAERFLKDIAKAAKLAPKRLTPAALRQLERYDWPGNVRELKNAMESLTLMNPSPAIEAGDLSSAIRGSIPAAIEVRIGTTLAEAERRIILRTLESHRTVKETAHVLGIGLRTLHTKLKQYGSRRRRR